MDDCVFAPAAAEQEGLVHNISLQMAGVSFKSPAAQPQLLKQQQQQLDEEKNSPLLNWTQQIRRQSDSFHFLRPSERRWVLFFVTLIGTSRYNFGGEFVKI